jgi:hypothetical protein
LLEQKETKIQVQTIPSAQGTTTSRLDVPALTFRRELFKIETVIGKS